MHSGVKPSTELLSLKKRPFLMQRRVIHQENSDNAGPGAGAPGLGSLFTSAAFMMSPPPADMLTSDVEQQGEHFHKAGVPVLPYSSTPAAVNHPL